MHHGRKKHGCVVEKPPELTHTHDEPQQSNSSEAKCIAESYGLTYLAATLSLAHHLDHVIRHNAVGSPLSGEINAFTMSLIICPIIITGLLLYRAGRVGPGFWALVSGGGARSRR